MPNSHRWAFAVSLTRPLMAVQGWRW